MNLPTKLLAGLLVIAASFLGGYLYRGSPVQKETATQVVVTDRVIERKTEPSTGAVTETIREKVAERANTSSRTPPVPAQKPQIRPQWSVSVLGEYDPALGRLVPVQLVTGYRVVGDLWLNAGADIRDRSLLLGVTYQWQ